MQRKNEPTKRFYCSPENGFYIYHSCNYPLLFSGICRACTCPRSTFSNLNCQLNALAPIDDCDTHNGRIPFFDPYPLARSNYAHADPNDHFITDSFSSCLPNMDASPNLDANFYSYTFINLYANPNIHLHLHFYTFTHFYAYAHRNPHPISHCHRDANPNAQQYAHKYLVRRPFNASGRGLIPQII